MRSDRLRDLLCEKPLSPADLRTIIQIYPQATPSIRRVLSLLLLLDAVRNRPGVEL